MYHGDDFTQDGDLFVMERGGWWQRGFLVFLWGCDVGQGFAWGCCAAAEVVVFHVYE